MAGGELDATVEVDPITALGTALSRPDGRVATLADRAGEGPLLVAVIERGCDVSVRAAAALAHSGARVALVSQGRPEAAVEVVARSGARERDVLVEPAPHPVSTALAAHIVPTFALLDGGDVVAWQDGWDRPAVTSLVRRAGGELDDDGPDDASEGSASRLGLAPDQQAEREADDAALPGGYAAPGH